MEIILFLPKIVYTSDLERKEIKLMASLNIFIPGGVVGKNDVKTLETAIKSVFKK